MKTLICLLMLVLLLFVPETGHSGWGWLIYHERSFRGRVIDAETKEPIEGAVVVVQYQVNMYAIVETHITLTDVREALTDQKGEFYVPSLTKLVNPLSVGYDSYFMVWKPGYKKQEVRDSNFFSKEPGTVDTLPVETDKGFEMKPVRLGVVELEKIVREDERRKAIPARFGEPSDFKNQKHFIQLINKERKGFGLEPFDMED